MKPNMKYFVSLILTGFILNYSVANAQVLPPVQPPKSKEMKVVLNCDGGRAEVFISTSPFHGNSLSVHINDVGAAKYLIIDGKKCNQGYATEGPCVDPSGRAIIDGTGQRVNGGFAWIDSFNSERSVQDPHPLTTVVYPENGGIKVKVVARYDVDYRCTGFDPNYGGCISYSSQTYRRAQDQELRNWFFKNCNKLQ